MTIETFGQTTTVMECTTCKAVKTFSNLDKQAMAKWKKTHLECKAHVNLQHHGH